jgi:gas vesicle protein
MSIKSYFEDLKQERGKKQKKESARKVLSGVVIGSAIGATAGILFAPKAGKETRQDISKKVKETAATAKEKVQETVGEVKEKMEGLKEKKTAIVDKAVETAEVKEPSSEDEELKKATRDKK